MAMVMVMLRACGRSRIRRVHPFRPSRSPEVDSSFIGLLEQSELLTKYKKAVGIIGKQGH